MAPACSARSPPKEATLNKFLRSLFFFFPPFCDSSIPAKLRCYCNTPRAQLLSGLIKRSRQFLATVNKSSGQRSVFTLPREFICYALWSSFRSLWKKTTTTTERRNKRVHCCCSSWFRGSLSTDFWLTGHLLDPAEGSEVTGGGCLLKQLMARKKERERGGGEMRQRRRRGRKKVSGVAIEIVTHVYTMLRWDATLVMSNVVFASVLDE